MASLDHLLSLTEDLIRIRSTHALPDNIRACRNFAARYFEGTGLTVTSIDNEGVPSIVVTKQTKTPKVFLSGHLDVIEAQDEQFTPRREGDRLYGRGALDMKSGDAVMMALMKEYAHTSHDVGLMLTGDEEIGGFHGVKHLLAEGYGCEVAIIPDGGFAVHRIVEKEKGALWIELKSEGRAVHGSVPWTGNSAILNLTRALHAIHDLFVAHDDHPENHWVSTCNIGMIKGGATLNQVADTASAMCDIRYTENDPPDEILARIRGILPEGVTMRTLFREPLSLVSLTHPLVIPFLDAIRAHGRTPETVLGHGGSDGRFFSARGIPAIISQPDGGNHHAKNEWVDIPSIQTYYKVLKTYLEKI